MTDRDSLREIVFKLFTYTDEREWEKLQNEVFTDIVDYDMSSLGGEHQRRSSESICEEWDFGFQDLDRVHHLCGNLLLNVYDNQADVQATATATHFKESAKNGQTRHFMGTYNLSLERTPNGWRISKFKFNLRFIFGNRELT